MKLNLYYVVRPSKEGDYSDCKLVGGPYSSWDHAHAAKSSELSNVSMKIVEHAIEVNE